jgi:hypothetical protein
MEPFVTFLVLVDSPYYKFPPGPLLDETMMRPLTYRLRGRHLDAGRTESIYDGRRRRRQQTHPSAEKHQWLILF